jgi:ferredoxin, 2Fe-2S
MVKIRFIEHTGVEHNVAVPEGETLMSAAINNLVPGIDADCGGNCACGTCHIVLEKEWLDSAGEIASEEESLLSMTPEVSEGSRLACQVIVTPDLEGAVVRLPEFQM